MVDVAPDWVRTIVVVGGGGAVCATVVGAVAVVAVESELFSPALIRRTATVAAARNAAGAP